MWREAQFAPSYTRSRSLDRWYSRSRSVMVRVFDDGREVDSFQSASAETLRAELRPIYRHLPKGSGTLQLLGVEERQLPLGINRSRREVQLSNLVDALTFLAA